MRPLQTSSPPTRSNAIDLLCQHASAREGGAKEQLVLLRTAPHRTKRKPRRTVAVEVRGAHPQLVPAGWLNTRVLRQRHDRRTQQQLQDGLRVVRQPAV